MRKLLYLLYISTFCVLYSCSDNDNTETITYKIHEPVFMNATAFRNSVKVSVTPQEISQKGKICFYENYLYISEPDKGIHIIDNRLPSTPKNVGYIELMGNADLSIRNNMLYADSYIDLVWFDISNPAQPELKGRLENVFEKALPPMEDFQFGYDYAMCYPNNENRDIIVGWTLVERTETVKRNPGWYYDYASMENSSSSGNSASGLNGSMSRFGLYQGYLYTVINNSMSIFNLSGEKPVKAADNIYIGGNVETIFSYKDNLFMGTPTGMLIYSVKDPLKPDYQSSLQHVYGCDPVVVENDLAYVTIHSGNMCGQNANELFIVDVSDVKMPKQIVSYTMTGPKGLGIDNGTLFLCDDGLKVYKSDDPQKLMSNQLAHHKGMNGYDVIPHGNTLMMIAENGLYQYDYSDLQNIRQISVLSIGK